jgi:signal peptidase II
VTLTPRAAWARAAMVLGAVVAVDQAVKALVVASLDRGERASLLLGIDVVNVRNSGVAFGALQDGGAIVVAVIVLAVGALLTYFALNARRPWAWLPVGMLLGGAIGNAIDRIREGAVIDFVKLPFWPAFNVADMSITFGVGVLLLVIEGTDGARRRS